MDAIRFERAAAVFAGVLLAAMIAAFAIGETRAQPVNPPITQPPPVFNPSSPNTVPQAPYTPIAPTAPSGLSGSGPAPASPAVVLPPSVSPQTNAPAAAEPARSRMHARHHGRARARWSKRHGRSHAVQVLGPSYYPGLGEFYPPYVNPCHPRQVWSGYYAGYWAYSCSW